MSSSLKAEHAALSWRIIEWKVAYYMPECVAESRRPDYTIDDDTYDAYEQRYLTLCRELGLPNTVVHKQYPGFEDVDYTYAMQEVDLDRPSVRLLPISSRRTTYKHLRSCRFPKH